MNPAVLQRTEALDRANEIRREGADFKRSIRAMAPAAGRRALADALEADQLSAGLGALRLDQAIAAITRIGPAKAHRCILRSGVLPSRARTRLRALTASERQRVAAGLRRWPR